jgi:hypothetical protein
MVYFLILKKLRKNPEPKVIEGKEEQLLNLARTLSICSTKKIQKNREGSCEEGPLKLT